MTVTYTSEVATAKKFGIFWKLLFRWRGSIYKLIWPELIVYLVLYYTLRFVYSYALNPWQKSKFEEVSLYCHNFSDLIPLTFVLGFYVNIVMTRWWEQYRLLPWPDNLAVFVSTSIRGNDDRGRLMRRTIMRYVILSLVMTLAMISPKVKKRFPTREHLVEAGFLTKNEKCVFERLDEHFHNPKNWIPLVWAGTVVTRSRKEGRIRDDFTVKTLLDTINIFRQNCGGLLSYDRISIPLVYTQVVTLAVYTFFFGSLMARQYLDTSKGYPNNSSDLYVPWFTLLQFIFYMGWLKVAETLVNPFGEDDDDFDINWLIDRHFQVSYLIVDGMHLELPDLVQDKYWDEIFPQELPYTVASAQYKTGPHFGSTAAMDVPPSHQYFVRTRHRDPLSSDSESEEESFTSDDRKKNLKKVASGDLGKSSKAELGKLISINEEEDAEYLDLDSESTLWITPGEIPRNPSVLSGLWTQLVHGLHMHRRASIENPELGNNSFPDLRTSSARSGLFHRSVSRQSENSPTLKKKVEDKSVQESSVLLPLVATEREDKKGNEAQPDKGITFEVKTKS